VNFNSNEMVLTVHKCGGKSNFTMTRVPWQHLVPTKPASACIIWD
jgi:hypothetical protein